MSSLELFAKNVRLLLEKRGWRIRDLADRTGISGAYLSQVLNGTKKNISDEYKDRIACALGVSVGCLYSDTPIGSEDDWLFVSNLHHEREELKSIVDTFLARTGLEDARSAFHAGCGLLNEKDARLVARYISGVLGALSSTGYSDGTVEPLTSDLTRLFSYCWLAGSGARVEWIREICGLEDEEFRQGIQRLSEMGYLHLVEESGSTRVRIAPSVPSPPLSSLFSQRGLQSTSLALAFAMQVFPDEGPAFEARLSDVLLKAGRYAEAFQHMQTAAKMLESIGHWHPAAEHWHRAAVIAGIISRGQMRVRCLCQAARCAAKTGDLEFTDSIGRRALALAQTPGQPAWQSVYVCISMGNAFQDLDLHCALKWYEKGLSCDEQRSQWYASLVLNVTGVLLQMKRTGEAEQYLGHLEKWIRCNQSFQSVGHYRQRCFEMTGIVLMQRHDWVGARKAFEETIAQSQGKQTASAGVAWHGLGLLSYYEDKCEQSREYYSLAEDCFLRLGLERQLEALYVDMAKVAVRKGAFKKAEELLSRSEKCPHEQPWILLLRACIAGSRGYGATAIRLAKAAIDGFRSRDFENETACATLWLSKLLVENGNLADARFYENWAFSIYNRRRWDVKHLLQQCSLLGARASDLP